MKMVQSRRTSSRGRTRTIGYSVSLQLMINWRLKSLGVHWFFSLPDNIWLAPRNVYEVDIFFCHHPKYDDLKRCAESLLHDQPRQRLVQLAAVLPVAEPVPLVAADCTAVAVAWHWPES